MPNERRKDKRGRRFKPYDHNFHQRRTNKNVYGRKHHGRKVQKRRDNKPSNRKFSVGECELNRQAKNFEYHSDASTSSFDEFERNRRVNNCDYLPYASVSSRDEFKAHRQEKHLDYLSDVSISSHDDFEATDRHREELEPYLEIKPELGTDLERRDLAARFVQIIVDNGHKIPIIELEDKLRLYHNMFFRTEDRLRQFINDFGRSLQICFDDDVDEDGELGSEILRCNLAIEICPTHAREASSCSADCGALHICKYFLLSSCDMMDCKFGHDLHTDHNMVVLEDQLLIRLSQDQIKQIVGNLSNRVRGITIPSICTYYNTEKGCRSNGRDNNKTCPFLHICQHYVKGDCRYRGTCRRSHNIDDRQPRELIEKYGLIREENETIFDLINNGNQGIRAVPQRSSSTQSRRHYSPPKQNLYSPQGNRNAKTTLWNEFPKQDTSVSKLCNTSKHSSDVTLPVNRHINSTYLTLNPSSPSYSPIQVISKEEQHDTPAENVFCQPNQDSSIQHVDDGEKDEIERSQNLIKRPTWKFAVDGESDLKHIPDSERDKIERKYQEYLEAKEHYLLIGDTMYKVDLSTFSGSSMETKDPSSIAVKRVMEKYPNNKEIAK